MFNHVGVKFHGDFGQLAETMLFYNKLTLFFIDEMSLRNLFKQVHPKILIPFLEDHKENINLRYLSTHVYPLGFYHLDHFSLHIEDEEYGGREDEPYLDYLSRTFSLDTPDGFETNKRLTNKLLDLITRTPVDINNFDNIIQTSVDGQEDLLVFAREYVQTFYPDLPPLTKNISIIFERKYKSAIDVKIHLSKRVSNRREKLRCLQEAIFFYFRISSEIHLWSTLSAEFSTSEQESFVIRQKINNLICRTNQSQQVIDQFQDVFIPDARNIKEVINSGEKPFHEFLRVYEKGQKFRGWVKDLPYDTNLLREYYRTVVSVDWLEKMPPKTLRWILFTGAGLGIDALGGGGIGTISGIALGAIDTFILDNLIRGWKPNQYINDEVSPFLKK